MLLILLTFVAIVLGYVLALAYWGALWVLRPVLDVFKKNRQPEKVLVVEPVAISIGTRAAAKLDHSRLVLQQFYSTKQPAQTYLQHVEPKALELSLQFSSSGPNEVAGPAVSLVHAIKAHPEFVRSNRVFLSFVTSPFVQPDVDFLTRPMNTLRFRVAGSNAGMIYIMAKHHGRETAGFQMQRLALRDPGFAPKPQTTTPAPNAFRLRYSMTPLAGAEVSARLFSGELAPTWR